MKNEEEEDELMKVEVTLLHAMIERNSAPPTHLKLCSPCQILRLKQVSGDEGNSRENVEVMSMRRLLSFYIQNTSTPLHCY